MNNNLCKVVLPNNNSKKDVGFWEFDINSRSFDFSSNVLDILNINDDAEVTMDYFKNKLDEKGQRELETLFKLKSFSTEFKFFYDYPNYKYIRVVGKKEVDIYFGYLLDVTEEKKIENDMANSLELYKNLFFNTTDAVVYFDKDTKIKDVNPSFESIFGLKKEEVMDKDLDEVVFNEGSLPLGKNIIRKMFRESNINIENVCFTKNGKKINANIKGVVIEKGNEVIGGYAIYTDLTHIKRYKERIEYLALHDTLTGIYNRAYFEEELNRYEKSREYPFTIIFIDLNSLKLINDTLGHQYGDKLLINAAGQIASSIRPSDIFARIGGDEFAIFLPRTNEEICDSIINRIKTNIEMYNNSTDNYIFPISLSIGKFVVEDNQTKLQDALKKAEDNMYRDKLLNSAMLKKQTLKTLMVALGDKDFITKGHADRVKEICLKIANKLNLTPIQKHNLKIFSEAHDIGKISIPDNILFKRGKLTDLEWETIKKHSEIGYRIALNSPELSSIADLILKHHERYDGTGYPLGLIGDEIPIECRILAIADAFDAMTNLRPYNRVKSKEEAIEEIKNNAGKQFDAYLVEIFVDVFEN